MSRTQAADACDRRSRTYPLTLLPVRRADEAFPKTGENIAIMTAEICAVQPSSGALYSRRTSPAPAACLRSPPPIRRAPNRSRQRHRNIILGRSQTTASFAACQWYAAATPTTPVHAARSREARAIDVARHADLNGQPAAHLSTRLSGAPQMTAADYCRSPTLRPDGRPCYLAGASSKPYRWRNNLIRALQVMQSSSS